MKRYSAPTASAVCADTQLTATLWDDMSFGKTENFGTDNTTSIVDINIPNNPEGDI